MEQPSASNSSTLSLIVPSSVFSSSYLSISIITDESPFRLLRVSTLKYPFSLISSSSLMLSSDRWLMLLLMTVLNCIFISPKSEVTDSAPKYPAPTSSYCCCSSTCTGLQEYSSREMSSNESSSISR